MKKIFLFLLTFLVIGTSTSFAQDTKAIKKIVKSSNKALKKYRLDPTNTAKLDEAKAKVEEAMGMDGGDKMPEVWNAKANIYQAIAENELASRKELEIKASIGLAEGATPEPVQFNFTNPEAPTVAYEAFSKALELTEKKSSRSKIIKNLQTNLTHLNDIGYYSYENKDYPNAYKLFNALVAANTLVKDNGGKPLLETPEKEENITFYTGLAAQYGEMIPESIAVFEKMYAAGTKKIEVYDALFRANVEKDEAAALKYLEEGRAIDPENVNLLFSEINFYLKKGEYAALEDKLKQAMDQEPNNASLRSVMGNVYNDFYKKETDPAKAEEYFNKSADYYNQALEIDDQSFEALYSLGELNYNRAAAMVTKYNELPISATQAEVDGLKNAYLEAFDKALPFFLKADAINSQDYNTILALKEIYAKKDDFAKSKEYKTRLETLK